MKHLHIATMLFFITQGTPALGVDLEAVKTKATSICASCHGVNGVSGSEALPNLQGQKETYLVNALKAYRDNSRKAPVMNNMAYNLSDEEIMALASYFSQLRP